MNVQQVVQDAHDIFHSLIRDISVDWRRLPQPPADPATVEPDPAWAKWNPVWPFDLEKNADNWFAGTLVFPERFLGVDLAASTAWMLMYGYVPFVMWVDGVEMYRETRPWHGTGPICDPMVTAVEPGRPYRLLINIRPTELPAHFDPLVMEIVPLPAMERVVDVLATVSELQLADALATSPTDHELVAQALQVLDAEAMAAHDWERFMTSATAMEATLAPMAERLRGLSLHLIGHTHIDMDWKWTWADTVMCARRDTKAAVDLLRDYPELRFSLSQVPLYEISREYDPEVFAGIQELAAAGRWENVAATWVEGDLNMADGESIARQALYASRWGQDVLGHEAHVMWEPDTFGHPGNMPQLARLSGCDTYFHWRCNPGAHDPWPARIWEGVDGSEILTLSSPYGGSLYPGSNEFLVMHNMVRTVRQGGTVGHHIWGSGDHGGGLQRFGLRLLERWRERPLMPRVRFSTVAEYRDALVAEGRELPRNIGETYHIFEGCYTTHARCKAENRRGEQALLAAETLSALADLPAREALEGAWKAVLFNQFHDIFDGAAVPDAYADAYARYDQALATAAHVTQASLQALPHAASPDAPPIAVEAVNTLAQPRRELMELTDVPADATALRAADGELLPLQRVGECAWAWSDEVPALGSRVYRYVSEPLPETASAALHVVETDTRLRIETPYATWTVNRQSGVIGSYVDKASGREWIDYGVPKALAHVPVTRLDLGMNLFQVLDEAPNPMSAWHINDILRSENLLRGAEVRIIDHGPVCVRVAVVHAFRQSRIEQEIRFYAADPRVDFSTTVDWAERGDDTVGVPQLKVSFGVALSAVRARHEGPFVVTERPASGAETVSQKWSAVAGDEGAFALYNRQSYGCDVLGSRLRLTLLRNAYAPDRDSDRGRHLFHYAFDPRTEDQPNHTWANRAASYSQPLLLRSVADQAASRSAQLTISEPAIRCTSLRPAEDGDGVVIRLFNSSPQAQTATLGGPLAVGSARVVDFRERAITSEPDVQAGDTLTFRPWQVISLRVHH